MKELFEVTGNTPITEAAVSQSSSTSNHQRVRGQIKVQISSHVWIQELINMLKSRRCLKVDAGALGSQRETMDRGRVSDFSIERILSPQLGPRPPLQDFPPNGYHRGVIGNVRAPSPVQVPLQAMGCQQCREMSFGEERFPLYRPAVHQQHFYSNPEVYAHFSQNRAGKQRLSQFKFYFFTKTLRLFFLKMGNFYYFSDLVTVRMCLLWYSCFCFVWFFLR